MMKKMSAVLALLMLLSFSGVGAEEITVKVAGDRNAVGIDVDGTQDSEIGDRHAGDFRVGHGGRGVPCPRLQVGAVHGGLGYHVMSG